MHLLLRTSQSSWTHWSTIKLVWDLWQRIIRPIQPFASKFKHVTGLRVTAWRRLPAPRVSRSVCLSNYWLTESLQRIVCPRVLPSAVIISVASVTVTRVPRFPSSLVANTRAHLGPPELFATSITQPTTRRSSLACLLIINDVFVPHKLSLTVSQRTVALPLI